VIDYILLKNEDSCVGESLSGQQFQTGDRTAQKEKSVAPTESTTNSNCSTLGLRPLASMCKNSGSGRALWVDQYYYAILGVCEDGHIWSGNLRSVAFLSR